MKKSDNKYETSPNNGGNQLTLASVCESKKSKTSAFAILAPAKRARIKPDLLCILKTLTFGIFFDT